ncbi:MAG: hypothetical protein CL920_36135 [Deltaproteobacteria bacterium]|nr:hypothetical protein [Deltaproteobacteria bacterium]MBU54158.1 hypothetical protein [Deltaproteobacteria bacterium]
MDSRLSKIVGSIVTIMVLALGVSAGACSPPVTNEPTVEKSEPDAAVENKDAPEPSRCIANNDGVIALSEIAFVADASVKVKRSAPNATVSVNQVGKKDADGTLVWDFTEVNAKTDAYVKTESPGGYWFSETFPEATLLIPERFSGYSGKIFQVIRKGTDSMLLEGLVSEKETPASEKVFLPYDIPVPLLRFPLREGKEWVITAKAQGDLGGTPITSQDRYQIIVDGRGTLKLPDIEFENTLRININVQQRFLGGKTRRLYQILYMHECYGEVARVESKDNETDPAFTSATLVRFISF